MRYRSRSHLRVDIEIRGSHGLFSMMELCLRRTPDKESAARVMVNELRALGRTRTRTGALYSFNAIRAAMRGVQVKRSMYGV